MIRQLSEKLQIRPILLYLLLAVIFLATVITIDWSRYSGDEVVDNGALKQGEKAYINHQDWILNSGSISSSEFLLELEEQLVRNGVNLLEYNTLSPVEAGSIGYDITISGPYQQLINVVSWIEQQPYFIGMENISFLQQENMVANHQESNYLSSFCVFNKG